MYIYTKTQQLLSFKVNTEANMVFMVINIYILIKHNAFY